MLSASSQRNDWMVGLLLFAPFFTIAALATLRYEWALQGDMALEVMRARDVGSNTPLLGAFSRYGWSHPGPALFFLLSIPAKVFSNPSLAVSLLSLLLKWVPLAASFVLLKRNLGNTTAFVFVGLSQLFLLNHRDGIWTIWNPTLGLSIFIFLAVLAISKDQFCFSIVFAVAASNVLVQFHIGFLAPTLLLLLIAVGHQWRAHSPTTKNKIAIDIAASIAVSIIIWLPPLLDQFVGTQNASEIFRYFTSTSENLRDEKVGLTNALEIISNQLLLRAPWNGRSDGNAIGAAMQSSPLWLLVLVVISGSLIFFNKKLKSPFTLPLGFILSTLIASSFIIAQSTQPAYPYLFGWITALSMLFWVILASNILSVMSQSFPQARLLNISIVATASLMILFSSVSILRQEPPYLFEMKATKHIAKNAAEYLRGKTEIGVLHAEGFAGIAFGLMLDLERQGKTLYVERFFDESDTHRERMWGAHRIDKARPPETMTVARGKKIEEFLASSEQWKLLTVFDPENLLTSGGYTATTSEKVVALLVRENSTVSPS